MSDLNKKLLNMGKGSREESGLGNRKQNEEEYEKAVGGPPEMPKANPPQQVDKIHPGAKYGDKPPEKRIDVDQYIKPLGSFEHGTDYVPKTGNYQLHEGEKVTPKEDNMADSKVFDMVPGRSTKKPAKAIHKIEIRKSHDGKHILVHKHHHPTHHPDEEHVATDMAGLHDHLDANPVEAQAPPMPGEAPAGAPSAAPPAAPPMTPPAA